MDQSLREELTQELLKIVNNSQIFTKCRCSSPCSQQPETRSHPSPDESDLHRHIFLVVVEVFGFGAVCICSSMSTFRRNMLSPTSGAEVRTQGSIWVFYRTWRIRDLLSCLVMSAPEDGDSMFLRNVDITCKYTRRQIPRPLQQYDNNRLENLKSHHIFFFKMYFIIVLRCKACIPSANFPSVFKSKSL
jgi:hypothetical protein